MLPDDVGECGTCGQPTPGNRTTCGDCEPPRDERGRFVARPERKGYDLEPPVGGRFRARALDRDTTVDLRTGRAGR